MQAQYLLWLVSLSECAVVSQVWSLLSTSDLWLLSDITPGNITNLELTIYSSKAVLFAQPLWSNCLFCHQLPIIYCSNRKFICVFFYFPHLKQFLIKLHRCEDGTCNIAFSSDCYSVAQSFMTSTPFFPVLLMLGSLVSTLEMSQAITYSFAGIFTLRTFAIYQNNWVVLSSLAVLGISRVSLATVSMYQLLVLVIQSSSWCLTILWLLPDHHSDRASILTNWNLFSILSWDWYKV